MELAPVNPPAQTHSPTFSPLYRQIRGLILRSLESGEWGPGELIPSESELAERFGVSQGTVRKAIDEMAAENLLIRRQGKGTFVATHADPHSFFRFLRVAANEGELGERVSIPIECWRAKAGADVARILAVEVGAPIIIIRRVLRFGNEPAVFDEIYLPGALFPDISMDVLRSADMSLYSLFETQYGVHMIRAEERLRAVAADRVCSEWLQVSDGTPLLLVERVTFTYGDKPVEWRRGFYATQHFHYYNELG